MVTKKFLTTTTNDMGDRELQDLLQDWDRIAPVGREFGSPDYERLEELDHLAILAKGSMLAARRWLDTPNQALECWRRFKIEPPCRLNFEPGLMANL